MNVQKRFKDHPKGMWSNWMPSYSSTTPMWAKMALASPTVDRVAFRRGNGRCYEYRRVT